MTNFFHASRGENKIKYIIKRGCFLFLKNVFNDIKHRNVLLKHVWYSFSSDFRRDLYPGTDGLNMFLAEDREETRGFLSFFFS